MEYKNQHSFFVFNFVMYNFFQNCSHDIDNNTLLVLHYILYKKGAYSQINALQMVAALY